MNLSRLFNRNPGRELAKIGAEQQRRKVIARTQQIRRELGLGDDPRLSR